MDNNTIFWHLKRLQNLRYDTYGKNKNEGYI